MGIDISISQRSCELIKKYKEACGGVPLEAIPATLDLLVLLSWLDDSTTLPISQTQLQESILSSLRVELLHDLCLNLNGDDPIEKKSELGLSEKITFVLLTLGGFLVAACEGFDSSVTMMGLLPFSPALILSLGAIFACLSIIAFCGLGIIKLSHGLGIKINETHQILEDSVGQLKEIKLIREKITNYNLAELTEEELEDIENILVLLEQRFNQLKKTSEHFNQVLNDGHMQAVQLILSGMASLFIFGGAFCAGQTTSFNVLSLFLTALTPASAPVVLCSLLIGFSAFSIYWALEYSGVPTQIGNWFGLQTEKIEMMCDNDEFAKESKKLASLKTSVHSTCELKKQLPKPESVIQRTSIYRFMPPVRSTNSVDEPSILLSTSRSHDLFAGLSVGSSVLA